jgi:hypothetical protein
MGNRVASAPALWKFVLYNRLDDEYNTRSVHVQTWDEKAILEQLAFVKKEAEGKRFFERNPNHGLQNYHTICFVDEGLRVYLKVTNNRVGAVDLQDGRVPCIFL